MLLLPPARRARVLRILASVTVLSGWAGLVSGGTSAAPLLLVFGYVVIVPLAIVAT